VQIGIVLYAPTVSKSIQDSGNNLRNKCGIGEPAAIMQAL
jgi:hypothetical protein